MKHVHVHTYIHAYTVVAIKSPLLYVKLNIHTVPLKGKVPLAARHALALDVYNVEFYSLLLKNHFTLGLG